MPRTVTLLLATLMLCGNAVHAQPPAPPDPEALIALLRAQKYAELDAQLGAYQTAYEGASDAEWPLVAAIGAFGRVDPDLEGRFDAWVSAKPASYVARLARAAYWLQRAWSSRGGQYSDETPPERLAQAHRYFELGEFDLRASLALTARPQLSHSYLITSAMARGAREQMSDSYLAARRLDPENYAARRAFLNAQRPEWGGSIALMWLVVRESESAPQTPKMQRAARHLKASSLGYLALEAERAKQYPEAIEYYGKGLAEIDDAVLFANRGRLLVKLKRLDEALRDFDRALALDPNSGFALERRGNLFEQRKQVKEAVRDYALAGSYGSTYAMRRLGIWYLNGGDGLAKNDVQALYWLRLGAWYGEDSAQMALGYMYSAARGGPQEPRQAYDLWRASAAQGNKQAQKYLDDVPWWWKARFAAEDWYGSPKQTDDVQVYRLSPELASLYGGGDGSSCDKAVVVNATDWRVGVAAEYRYLEAKHPGGRRVRQSLVREGDRKFDRIEWLKPEGLVSVCFDVNQFFGHR